jgi:hypothetical protein
MTYRIPNRGFLGSCGNLDRTLEDCSLVRLQPMNKASMRTCLTPLSRGPPGRSLLTLTRELEQRRSPPLTRLTRLAGAGVSGERRAHICELLAPNLAYKEKG